MSEASSAALMLTEETPCKETKKRKEKKSRRKNILTAFSDEKTKETPILPITLEESLTFLPDTENDDKDLSVTERSEEEQKTSVNEEKKTDKEEELSGEKPSAAEKPEEAPAERIKAKPVSKPVAAVDGMKTDARLTGDSTDNGIIYEIAEELYIREKTLSELEGMCSPPFHKVFSSEQTAELDAAAHFRSGQIAGSLGRAAAAGIPGLPDGYTPMDRPLSTLQAFIAGFIMLLPGVNICAAIIFAFARRSNYNTRALGRGFLIWSVIFMTAALCFFGWHYFSSPEVTAKAAGLLKVLYT